MTVRVSDPFGLIELGRAFRTTVPLTVTPRTVPLPPIPLGGAWTGSGDNRPRAFATGSAEDVTVREYRRGDDLRRVHWRSSARVGELMVRREEQPWQSRATLFLDNRLRAHRGQGIASSLEAAVSAAASIAVHLSHRGFTVRLVTATGEDPAAPGTSATPTSTPARCSRRWPSSRRCTRPRLDTGWLTEGGPRRPHRRRLRQRRGHGRPACCAGCSHHAGSALAIALDVDAWVCPAPRRGGGSAPVLAQQGWRAVSLGPRDRLDTVWQELGRSGKQTTAVGSGCRPPRRRSRPGEPARGGLAAAAPARRRRGRDHLGGDVVVARVHDGAGPVPRSAAAARRRGGRRRRAGPLVAAARAAAVVGLQVLVSGLVAQHHAVRLPAAGRARLGRACSTSSPTPWTPAAAVRRAGAGAASRACTRCFIAGGLACLLLVDAARLHAAPGAAGRAAAAHGLQRAGQPARAAASAWWVFALTAGGFLTLLFLQESEQVARWGRTARRGPGVGRPRRLRASAPARCGPRRRRDRRRRDGAGGGPAAAASRPSSCSCFDVRPGPGRRLRHHRHATR